MIDLQFFSSHHLILYYKLERGIAINFILFLPSLGDRISFLIIYLNSLSLCKFIQIPTLTFFAIQMISLWIKKLSRLRFFFLYILQWTLTKNYPNIGTKEQIDYVSGFMIWTEKPRKIHTFTLTMLQILKLEPTMLLYISILMWEIK